MDMHDVVVVGGGGSGLAAAIGAASRGASVIVLEKEPFLRGSTGMSVGSITSSRTELQKQKGIEDSPDEHFHDMGLFAGALAPRDNLELRRILVYNVPETVRWLTSLGVVFFGPMPEPPHRKPRMHNILPNSRAYIHILEKECRRHGVEFVLGARATKLIREGDRVTAVEASVSGSSRRFSARKAVILTSGDYNNGRELRRRFTNVSVDIPGVNANEGDGQRMGLELGAEVLNGDIVWGPLIRFLPPPRESILTMLPPLQILGRLMRFSLNHLPAKLLRPFVLSYITTFLGPELSLFKEGAILVNKHGQRFTNERDKPAHDLSLQPDTRGFIVMDRSVMDKFTAYPFFVSTAPGAAFAYLPDYRRNRKDVYHEAPTLDQLAAKMGVDEKALRETIAAYNASLPAQTGQKGGEADRRQPVVNAPFCALGPVETRVVITDGGLKVNQRHQVLGGDGQPVPGLFAAGSTGQGGLLLEGHGHHLGWAFTSGRRAGQFAVEGTQA